MLSVASALHNEEFAVKQKQKLSHKPLNPKPNSRNSHFVQPEHDRLEQHLRIQLSRSTLSLQWICVDYVVGRSVHVVDVINATRGVHEQELGKAAESADHFLHHADPLPISLLLVIHCAVAVDGEIYRFQPFEE